MSPQVKTERLAVRRELSSAQKAPAWWSDMGYPSADFFGLSESLAENREIAREVISLHRPTLGGVRLS
jgi:hypothetical protein